MKKNILFVINPVSGGKSKLNFPKLALQHLDSQKFNPEFVFTESRGHAFELAQKALAEGTEILVSVGGDGTINEVASAVEGTSAVLGIIPFGSGNGLARSLKIPLGTSAAIQTLNKLTASKIDTGIFNKKKFFNMAGLGFDAHISAVFAMDVKRGLTGYVKTAFSEVSQYIPQNYQLEIDGKSYNHDAFMISIANSSQYGNNAHISPYASLKDGLLDVCIIRPFPLYKFPAMGYRMFRKNTHTSKYVDIIQGSQIRISRETGGAVHLDGEPIEMGTELNIGIHSLSLSILN